MFLLMDPNLDVVIPRPSISGDEQATGSGDSEGCIDACQIDPGDFRGIASGRVLKF